MNTPRQPDDETDEATWEAQRRGLRALHREVLDEPIPAGLLAAAQAVATHRERQQRWARWGGMAAGIVVAFGAGWIANGQLEYADGSPGRHHVQVASNAASPRQETIRDFIHAASIAHSVYTPEKRHPVEVSAAEEQHLAQWLSRRLDKPLKVPDLSVQGYALVGGRLLPGNAGARAQFMFERAGGMSASAAPANGTAPVDRITLYIGSVDDAERSTETAFRFSEEGGVSSFYWVDHGFGYALAGDLPRKQLLDLATEVYRQL